MSYLIAAAGTGGHVFPGLAVGEALVDLGVEQEQVHYIGGNRLEAEVFPQAGFPFLSLPLAGLRRQFTWTNLKLPAVMARAARRIMTEIDARGIRAVLGMGGYVTGPVAWAAKRSRTSLFLSEQNADAGLANRLASRWADRVFGSFPRTRGLPTAQWVGNPIRRQLRSFSRNDLRLLGRARYGLDPEIPVVGVIGGSLGAEALNRAATRLADVKPRYQILNLTGRSQHSSQRAQAEASSVKWVVKDFEPEIEYFFAAIDLAVARAGGAVAELTATATPAILIPGRFGSSGHQVANAAVLAEAGAALVLEETELDLLPGLVDRILDPQTHRTMEAAAAGLARPNAAIDIATSLIGAHDRS